MLLVANREVGSVGSEEDYAALLIAAIYGKVVGLLHAHDVAAPSFLLKGESTYEKFWLVFTLADLSLYVIRRR